jgi:hypothetical protein
VEKLEASCTVGSSAQWCRYSENSRVDLQNLKNRLTVGSCSVSGYIHKRIESEVLKRCLYTSVRGGIVAQTETIHMNEWVSQIWHLHTREYYSASKRKEALKPYNIE